MSFHRLTAALEFGSSGCGREREEGKEGGRGGEKGGREGGKEEEEKTCKYEPHTHIHNTIYNLTEMQ